MNLITIKHNILMGTIVSSMYICLALDLYKTLALIIGGVILFFTWNEE